LDTSLQAARHLTSRQFSPAVISAPVLIACEGREGDHTGEHVSASFSRVVTAFGYFEPYSVANRCAASRAWSRVSAYIISWSAAFTRGWSRFGSLSRILPSLWNQSRCSRVFGHTSRTAARGHRHRQPRPAGARTSGACGPRGTRRARNT